MLQRVSPKSRHVRRMRQEITIGILTEVTASGACVDFPANTSGRPVVARTTAPLDKSDAGREVAMLFEFGDPMRPLIIGLIQQTFKLPPAEAIKAIPKTDSHHVRAERIVLDAEGEIVLKTKRAKLVLRENGDIEVHGMRIVSRARTVQKLLAPMLKLN
jgi:Domain of unknown function (DUF6484)